MDGPMPILAALYRRQAGELTVALGGRPAPTAGGHTALHETAFHGNLELVQLPLAHGADATARDDDGQTPLDIAQAKGHAALARRLRGELP